MDIVEGAAPLHCDALTVEEIILDNRAIVHFIVGEGVVGVLAVACFLDAD